MVTVISGVARTGDGLRRAEELNDALPRDTHPTRHDDRGRRVESEVVRGQDVRRELGREHVRHVGGVRALVIGRPHVERVEERSAGGNRESPPVSLRMLFISKSI